MLIDLIKADIAKQKRSPLIFVIMLAPVAIAALLFLDFSIRFDYLSEVATTKGVDMWQILIKEQNITYFKQFILVFGAVILVGLFDEEYKNNGWTLVMTYPVKKWQIVISKFITSIIYMALLLIINVVALIIVGKLAGFADPINIDFFIKMMLFQFIGVLGTMVIHLAIVLWNKKTYITIVIALVASIFSGQVFFNGADFARYIPYNYPLIADGLIVNNLNGMATSAICMLICGMAITIVYFNKKKSY